MSHSAPLAQTLEVAIEMIPRDTDPEQVLEELAAHAQASGAQHLDAIVLDADEQGLEKAVEWVRTFNSEYLRRQATTSPEAWENALRPRPNQASRPVPPVVIVLASPSRLNQELGNIEAQLAGGGAVVYEKPFDQGAMADFAERLREELTETYSRFWADEQNEDEQQSPKTSREPTGQADLGAYLAPLYRLSDEDFEALLERGRSADPLATGE
jgi:hypothetical protein